MRTSLLKKISEEAPYEVKILKRTPFIGFNSTISIVVKSDELGFYEEQDIGESAGLYLFGKPLIESRRCEPHSVRFVTFEGKRRCSVLVDEIQDPYLNNGNGTLVTRYERHIVLPSGSQFSSS